MVMAALMSLALQHAVSEQGEFLRLRPPLALASGLEAPLLAGPPGAAPPHRRRGKFDVLQAAAAAALSAGSALLMEEAFVDSQIGSASSYLAFAALLAAPPAIGVLGAWAVPADQRGGLVPACAFAVGANGALLGILGAADLVLRLGIGSHAVRVAAVATAAVSAVGASSIFFEYGNAPENVTEVASALPLFAQARPTVAVAQPSAERPMLVFPIVALRW